MRWLLFPLLAGCALKLSAPPVPAGAPAPDEVAWLGALDARIDRATTETVAVPYVVAMPNGTGGVTPVTHYRAGTVHTGRLDGALLLGALQGGVAEVVAHDLHGVGGTDIASLSGVQNLSAAYPDHRYLVVVELTGAEIDLRPYKRKVGPIVVVSAATLGLGLPFLAPWIMSPSWLPVSAEANLKVFDRDTGRFEHVRSVSAEATLTARGVAWWGPQLEKMVTEAGALAGATLAREVADALAELPLAVAPEAVRRVAHVTALSRAPEVPAGSCLVEVWIDVHGAPTRVEPDDACADPAGARDAVMQWRFEPVQIGESAVPARFPLRLEP